MMINYQVQYKDREGNWVNTGPRLREYSDALDRLKEENFNDPEYTHRIVQMREVTTVLSVIAGVGDLEEAV